MFLIVGLGNPGAKYALNRHNIGFMVVDALATNYDFPSFQKKFDGQFSKLKIGDVEVGLLKPQTYMNNSGSSVQQAMQFYKISPENVWVIHDEVDLISGKLRIKKGGGSGGHNGIKDIDASVGPDYWRLRLGVGRPSHTGMVADYVLDNFSGEDEEWLVELLKSISKNFNDIISGNTEHLVSAIQKDIESFVPKIEEEEKE